MKRYRHLLHVAILLLSAIAIPQLFADNLNPLERASQLAREAESYQFSADITQNYIPRPHPQMIGKQDETVEWVMNGSVDETEQRAAMELGFASAQATQQLVQVVHEGGQTFLRSADGYIEPLEDENPLGIVAPSTDFLTYLDAAGDVERVGTQAIGGETYTHYRFTLSGEQIGRLLVSELQADRPNTLPGGFDYSVPETYSRMTGTGEVWLDEAGYPRRQTLDLLMPEANELYDARLHMRVDFRNYGEPLDIPHVTTNEAGAWVMTEWTASPIDFSPAAAVDQTTAIALSALPHLLLSFTMVFVGLLVLRLYLRHPKRVYRWFAIPFSLMMIVTPLVTPLTYHIALARHARAAADQPQQDSPIFAALGVEVADDESQSEIAPGETTKFSVTRNTRAEDSEEFFSQCGDGATDEDADGDGLTDFAENCIGTSQYNLDTDYDTITDSVEIAGFTMAGRTWTTDPSKIDSNQDGLSDVKEWPAPIGLAPVDSHDPDGDDIPSVWDDDNDGDGVHDSIDLSPFHMQPYRNTLDLNLSGDTGDDYLYIEFQVQPENSDHLRYTTTPLDWPLDTLGNVQDLDDSPGDITLIPYLEVLASARPNRDIAQKYGILVSADDDQFRLSIPLLTQGTGKVSNFYGKLVYAPDDFDSVRWEWARLAWAVNVQNDLCLGCGPQDTRPVHTYYEPYRLTGLQVIRSGEYEVAFFGTPSTPTEDKTLFQFAGGLYHTFMDAMEVSNQPAQRSMLHEISLRVQNPVAPYNSTWGIDEPLAALDTPLVYTHQDEMLAYSGDEIFNFLNTHYTEAQYAEKCTDASGSEFRCASLVTATRSQLGSAELGVMHVDILDKTFDLPEGSGQTTQSSVSVQFDLAQVVPSEVRDVSLTVHEFATGRWQLTTPARMMELIMHRYSADDWQTMADEMQAEYPAVDADWMRVGAFLGYITYHVGLTRVSQYGETPLLSPFSDDPALTAEQSVVGNNYSDAPSQLLETSGVANALGVVEQFSGLTDVGISSVGSIFDLIGAIIDIRSYSNQNPTGRLDTFLFGPKFSSGEIKVPSGLEKVGTGIGLAAAIIGIVLAAIAAPLSVALVVCGALEADSDAGNNCDEDALKGVNATVVVIGIIANAISLIVAIMELVKAIYQLVKAGATLAATITAATVVLLVVGIVIAIAAALVQIVVIWVMFGLLAANSKSRATVDEAIGEAIVATIIALILLVVIIAAMVALMIFPVGTLAGAIVLIVIAIGALVDAILVLVTMFTADDTYSISGFITGLIAKTLVRTTLISEPGDVSFEGAKVKFDDAPDFMHGGGAVENGGVLLSDTFSGEIDRTGTNYTARDFFQGDYVQVNERHITDDLHDSGALAWYEGSAPSHVRIMNRNSLPDGTPLADRDTADASDDSRCEVVDPGEQILCRNHVGSRFDFGGAGRNQILTVRTFVDFDLRYELCILFGCKIKTEDVNLPDALDDDEATAFVSDLIIDILPADLTGFWEWSEIRNDDRDGDGLDDVGEASILLQPDKWDSDNDGLSDGFELNHAAKLGTNPYVADTDEDGLLDGLELSIGTRVDDADSDDDGLLDGEEVFHQNADSDWEGGWEIVVPTAGTLMVYSDPLLADADNDLLTDSQERDNGTSPYAPNDAPGLLMLPHAPQYQPSDNGQWAIYVEPGDTISLTVGVASVGKLPVDQTLSVCLPATLINISAGAMGPDRTPRAQTFTCANGGSGYRWNFGSDGLQDHTLQIGEYADVLIVAQADPTVRRTSVADQITYRLPYDDKVLDGAIGYFVDDDDPSVSFRAPQDGAVLNGSSFVVGGNADDPTSWVTDVQIDVDDGNGFVSATGTGPWAHSWHLPADGVYTLRAQSVDHFGRTSPIESVDVTVDNTPPTVSTTFVEGALINNVGSTVQLTGSATDNLSGVAQVQIRIDDTLWQATTLSDNGTSSTWSYDWQLGFNAQGDHKFELRSFDAAGNISDVIERNVVVDVVPPSSNLTTHLTDDTLTTISTDPGATIFGYANDVGNLPQPPRPVELAGEIDSLNDATVWLSAETVHDDDAGVNLVWLGDLNGDGRGDMAIGLPNADDGAGRIHIVYGKAGDWTLPAGSELLSDSGSSIVGTAGAELGTQIAAVGDVNADNLADFLIGDPANNRAILVYGRTQIYGDTTIEETLDGSQRIFTAPDGFGLGQWVSAAGDVNNDGASDFFIGGNTTGLLITSSELLWDDADVDAPLQAAASVSVSAESRIIGVGDLNNDQLDDWVVTDPTDALGGGVGLYLQSAALFPAFTPGSNIDLAPTTDNHHLFASSGFGPDQAVALGDVNGDDIDDFIFSSGNAPRLVLGSASSTWAVHRELSGYAPAPNAFLVAPGDVNADGLNDILLGTAVNTAYLIHGALDFAATPPVAATVLDVADAASTPFAAGADVNCDFSSDLLVLPQETQATPTRRIDFEDTARYAIDSLPVAAAQETEAVGGFGRSASQATLHVDDDQLCGGNAPCFASIQAAVDSAAAGDTITVYPGLYTPFTLATSDVTVQGVNPDAVFVDGQGGVAVTVSNADGVRVSRLTLRNVSSGVQLVQAGVSGEMTPTLRTQLDRLLVYDFDHAVSMDRVSTLAVADSTFASDGSSAEIIHTTGESDPRYTPQWEQLSDWDGGTIESGGTLVADTATLYAVPNADPDAIGFYDPATDSWSTNSSLPSNLGTGGELIFGRNGRLNIIPTNNLGSGLSAGGSVNAVVEHEGDLYIGGSFTSVDGVAANNVAYWDGDEWHSLGSGANGVVRALASSGGSLYVGGDFSQVGNVDAANIGRWNDSWYALGSGLDGTVHALEADGTGGVFVGGNFTEPAGLPLPNLSGVREACKPTEYQVVLFEARNYGKSDPDDECYKFDVGNHHNANGAIFPSDHSNSILVGRFVRAILYDETNLQGSKLVMPHSVADLDDYAFENGEFAFQDVGSLRVEAVAYAPTTPPSNSDCSTPNDYEVVGYYEPDFSGECTVFSIGTHNFLQSDNDEFSSMYVGELVYVEAYRNEELSHDGGMAIVARPYEHLKHVEFSGGDHNLDNSISSLEVKAKASSNDGGIRHNLAQWNGVAWQTVNEGVGGSASDAVYALEKDGDRLYIGGNFDQASRVSPFGNFAIRHIVDREWGDNQSLGLLSANGTIHSIAANNGLLALGGAFNQIIIPDPDTVIDIVPSPRIAFYDGSAWQTLGSGLDDTVYAVDLINETDIIAGGDFSSYIQRWNGSSWNTYGGGANARVNALLRLGDDLYAGGAFTDANSVDVNGVTRWAQSYRVLPNNIGRPTLDTHFALHRMGGDARMVKVDNDTTYAIFIRNNRYRLWGYKIGADSWTEYASHDLGGLPERLDIHTVFAYADGALHLLLGSNNLNQQRHLRYDIADDSWSVRAAPPFTAFSPAGAWDGGDYLYVTARGDGATLLRRYHLTEDRWESLDALMSGLNPVGPGSGLVNFDGTLYLTIGGDSSELWRFEPVSDRPTKLTLENVVMAVPESAATATWFGHEQDDSWRDDFGLDATNVELVGGVTTWTPLAASGTVTHTHTAAAFLDYAANGVRVSADSALTGGYYDYAPPATVSAENACSTCFTSIQAAIDSGAQAVTLDPGVYQELFYLVSGVTLLGSGAAMTIIEPDSDTVGLPLVTLEGVQGVTVANLTLNGEGSADGLHIEDGSDAIRITRNIIRDAQDAIALDGATTDVQIFNNTLVNNVNGVQATNNASIDVRNTLFVNHGGDALSYQSGAATTLHRYNGYFGNSQDFVIDGSPASEPGLGEIFADPVFSNVLANDFTLVASSPMIDAGSPGDPTPPGTGGRIDIGYAEFGAAGFYADDEYCQTCLNDGLLFGVDAFSTISEALAAANSRTMTLGVPDSGFNTVGVAAGVYNERLTMPSYVRLVCSGADETTIRADDAPTIQMERVRNVAIEHCHITGSPNSSGVSVGEGSSNVLLRANLIAGNGVGLLFADDATGQADFNTLVDNAQYGARASHSASLALGNSIVANNGSGGLQADGNATITSDFNVLFNAAGDYDGVTAGLDDISADPQLIQDPFGNPYHLAPTSPALDSANPLHTQTVVGGGANRDRGAFELTAVPFALLFGMEGESCVEGNSGVASAEYSLVPIADTTQPISTTVPTDWQAATLNTPNETASYWTATLSQLDEGLYRLFSRATDANGNVEDALLTLYDGQIRVDNSAPDVAWVSPADNSSSDQAAVRLVGRTTAVDAHSAWFMVNGTRHAATWQDVAQSEFAAWIPVQPGDFSATAHVADGAGNAGVSAERNFSITDSGNVATIISQVDGGTVDQATLHLTGFARFTSGAGVGKVTVQVDGGAPIEATLDDPSASFTSWTATVVLPNSGQHQLTTSAERSTRASSAPHQINVTLDQVAPQITITTPAANVVFSDTVNFTGTATDDSGVSHVEVSVDNGTTWMLATLNGDQWSLTWNPTGNNSGASYVALARATDVAGGQATDTVALTIDIEPPAGVAPATFSLPQDAHFDSYQTLTVAWQEIVDNTATQMFASLDQSAESTPTQAVTGNSLTGDLDANGDWYAHLMAVDAAGNRTQWDFGPWRIGTFADPSVACGVRSQSITLDGFINVPDGEWDADERLGNDVRHPDNPVLYTTWDGDGLYLGLSNGWFGDGKTWWAYLDSVGGGTTQSVEGERLLPLSAEYAIEVSSQTTGRLWTYSGHWSATPLTFVHTTNGGTEVHIPWDINTVSSARLLSYIEDGAQAVAVFPTSNRLSSLWDSVYTWNNICDIAAPNDGQPTGAALAISISSPQPELAGLGPNNAISYTVSIFNYEQISLTNVAVTLSPSAGLNVLSASSPTISRAGDPFVALIPTLPARETVRFTVAGELDADLSGIDAVLLTTSPSRSNLPGATQRHVVDAIAPTVDITDFGENVVVNSGNQLFNGTAADNYAGVMLVEVRKAGDATWLVASGTAFWNQILNVAGDTVTVEARATDAAGNVSAIDTVTFTVDTTPPVITPTLTTVITATGAVTGTAQDIVPAEGGISLIEIQRESADRVWHSLPFAVSTETNEASWFDTFAMVSEANITKQYRVRATDYAGNVATSDWLDVVIDKMVPTIVVTKHITEVAKTDYAARAGEPVLAGTVSDGAGVQTVVIRIQRPDGTSERVPTTAFNGTEWSFTPTFELSDPNGRYNLFVEATDANGNVRTIGAYALDVDADQLAVSVAQIETGTLASALVWLFVVQLLLLTVLALRLRRRE